VTVTVAIFTFFYLIFLLFSVSVIQSHNTNTGKCINYTVMCINMHLPVFVLCD